MADVIYYIDEDYIREYSEVQDNLDIKKLKRSIRNVQRIFIENTLGTALYKDINNNISGGTITGDYQVLLEEYLQPMVLEYALYKALPYLNYSMTNKAVVKKEADNTINTELSELKFLQAQYKDSADDLGQRCIKYLIQGYNDGKFPLYSCKYNQDFDEMSPDSTSPFLFGGIFLGESSSDNNCRDYLYK